MATTPVSPGELKAARLALTATFDALAAARSDRDEFARKASDCALAHWDLISKRYLDEAIASVE